MGIVQQVRRQCQPEHSHARVRSLFQTNYLQTALALLLQHKISQTRLAQGEVTGIQGVRHPTGGYMQGDLMPGRGQRRSADHGTERIAVNINEHGPVLSLDSAPASPGSRSEEHTSELQSRPHLV